MPSVFPATFHREEEENGAMPAPNSQLDKDGITKIDRWLLGKWWLTWNNGLSVDGDAGIWTV